MEKFQRYLWIALIGVTVFAFTLFLFLSLFGVLVGVTTDLDPMAGQSFFRGGVHFFFYAAFTGAMMILGVLISRQWRRGKETA